MDGLSPWVSSLLTALGIFGTLLGLWLARRGKREDNKRAEAAQSFTQIQAVADARLKEIERKDVEIARLLLQADALRADVDRIRGAWEDRWERQMKRCREITQSLVEAIAALKKAAGPAHGDAAVETAMNALHQHNEDDHDELTEAL